MKDNMRNLREITNLVLKDIHVTEKLKNDTLKKCKYNKKIKLKPAYAAGISAAIITLSLINYKYYTNGDITKKYIYNNPIAKVSIQAWNKITGKSVEPSLKTTEDKSKETTPDAINPSINSEVSQNTKKDTDSKSNPTSDSKDSESNLNKNSSIEASSPESKATDSQKENTTPETADKTTDETSTEALEETKVISSDMPNLASAQDYFGGSISTPSYVPENFTLTDIHIPEDIQTGKIVTMDYNSPENKYFKLTQSKKDATISPYNSFNIAGEKVSINDAIQGYICIYNDPAVSNSSIVQISWIKDNIEYTLYGNISKDSILSIAKSIDYTKIN